VSGEFNFKTGDGIVTAPARSIVFVPRGTVHTFQNVGTEPSVLLVRVTPGGFEKMFEERQGADTETNRTLMKKHNMEALYHQERQSRKPCMSASWLKMIGTTESPCPESYTRSYTDFARRPRRIRSGDRMALSVTEVLM